MSVAGLFVIGTDTGVGKTSVSAEILRDLKTANHRAGAIKPISTSGTNEGGRFVSPDALILAKAIGPEILPEQVCPIVLEGDIAPSVAIRLNRLPIRFADVVSQTLRVLDWWQPRAEIMLIEGVGGFLCPITEDATVADLAVILDYPLVLVARRGLGTLNHTLLTVEAAKMRGLRVAGVILNGSEPTTNPLAEATNADELAARLGGVPILAEISYGGLGTLGVDWYGLAKPPRMAPSPPS